MALVGVFLKREFLVALADPSAVSFELKSGIRLFLVRCVSPGNFRTACMHECSLWTVQLQDWLRVAADFPTVTWICRLPNGPRNKCAVGLRSKAWGPT